MDEQMTKSSPSVRKVWLLSRLAGIKESRILTRLPFTNASDKLFLCVIIMKHVTAAFDKKKRFRKAHKNFLLFHKYIYDVLTFFFCYIYIDKKN